jgi:hypothetical protein
MAIAGVGVYLGHFLVLRATGLSAGLDLVTASEAAHLVVRSALPSMSVLCGLLLVVFVEAPSTAWAGGDELSGDRRPALLASGLLGAFVTMLAIAPLREFFDLVALDVADYALLAAVAITWAFVVRWTWRARVLDRSCRVLTPGRERELGRPPLSRGPARSAPPACRPGQPFDRTCSAVRIPFQRCASRNLDPRPIRQT